jgi:hypothetical protein
MPSTLAQQKIQSLFSQDELMILLSLCTFVSNHVQYGSAANSYVDELNTVASKLKLLVKQNGPNYHG